MRISRPLETSGSFFIAGVLLLGLWACSSSEGPPPGNAAGAEEIVNAKPAPPAGEMPAVTKPVQQEGNLQELVERRKALQEKRKVVAAEYLKTGKAYFERGQLQEALKAFENALDLDSGSHEAERMRDQTAALLGLPPRDKLVQAGQALSDEAASLNEASVMARNHFSKGHHFMAEREYPKAVGEYRKALIIMRARPLMDLDFNQQAVVDALQDAQKKADRASEQAQAARVKDVERIRKERETKERKKLQRRLQRLWREALAAGEQERFKEVIRLSNAIVELDYKNDKARDLREMARRALHAKSMGEIKDAYRDEWQRAFQNLKDLGRPFSVADSPFPDLATWRKIASRGPIQLNRSATTPSEADNEVRSRLEGTILTSVDWRDQTLDDAIKFIKNNTNVNIIITKAADEAVPADERGLDLNLENPISAMSALNLALDRLKLVSTIEDGVLKVTTKEGLAKNKVVELYNVRDLTAKLTSFPGIEINLSPSGVNPGEDTGDEGEGEEEENRAIESEQLQELIKNAVDPGWDDGEGNSMLDKNGTLVIRQTPIVHRKIAKLLADLRQSIGIQVRIETRFISVENNFLQDIGVDFRGLGDNSGGVGFPGRGTAAPFDDFGLPGTSSPIGSENSSGAFFNKEVNIRARTQNLFDQPLGNPDVLTSTGGFSLQYAYLDNTQLEAILRAVQKYERINTVSAPSLTVFNTQRANLAVTRSIAYIKDFDVEIAQAAVIADPIVDVAKEGVVLDVRPIVSNDHRFITLELRPTVSTLRMPFRTFTTTLGVGTAVTFEVPELRKESLKTTVVMPDGGTLLLGGLKFFEEQLQDSGVPFLKDIPVVGFLFGRKGKFTNMRDLIILLRAKILIMEEDEPDSSFAGGQ